MPVFSAKHIKVRLDAGTGEFHHTLGAGDGAVSWPEIAEGGRAVANVVDKGVTFLGRIHTTLLEGEVTVNLFHIREDIDTSEFFDAVLHRGKWADALTCDPGGEVWAPSLYIEGEANGQLFALRWESARISVSGAQAVEGGTLAFKAAVVGEPLYGTEARDWP